MSRAHLVGLKGAHEPESKESKAKAEGHDDCNVRGPTRVPREVPANHVVKVLREWLDAAGGPIVHTPGGSRREPCRPEDEEQRCCRDEGEEGSPNQESDERTRLGLSEPCERKDR